MLLQFLRVESLIPGLNTLFKLLLINNLVFVSDLY